MAKKKTVSPEEAWSQAFAATDHSVLFEGLGATISDETLKIALTHRSFSHENGNVEHNERLEFLGDAVLGLAVAEDLYSRFPDRTEADISRMRAGVVNMYALADVARLLGLGEHLILGKGEEMSGGRDKNSLLADTTEALLGSIYLEHGWDVARGVIRRLFDEKIRTAPTEAIHVDWKTDLLEKIAGWGLGDPTYRTEQSGLAHDPHFSAVVEFGGIVYGRGEGHTKKEAEHKAAKEAHAHFSQNPLKET